MIQRNLSGERHREERNAINLFAGKTLSLQTSLARLSLPGLCHYACNAIRNYALAMHSLCKPLCMCAELIIV